MLPVPFPVGIYRFQSEAGAEFLLSISPEESGPAVHVVCSSSCNGLFTAQPLVAPAEYRGKLERARDRWNVLLNRLNGKAIGPIRAELVLKNPRLLILVARRSLPFKRFDFLQLSYHAMPESELSPMVFSAGHSGPHLVVFKRDQGVFGWLLAADDAPYAEWVFTSETIRWRRPEKETPPVHPGLFWGPEAVYTLIGRSGERMLLRMDTVRTPVTDVSGFLERPEENQKPVRLTQANDSNTEARLSCLNGTCDWFFSTPEAILIFRPGLRRAYRARYAGSGKVQPSGAIKNVRSDAGRTTVFWSNGLKQYFYPDR
ncbi:MAG: hypothetical protein HS115_17065 [Spirochaetales bacterium]|nr:hypothetical protein [Spirochaetales bacterium]